MTVHAPPRSPVYCTPARAAPHLPVPPLPPLLLALRGLPQLASPPPTPGVLPSTPEGAAPLPLPPPRNSAIRASEFSAQGLPDAPAPPAPVVPPAPEPLVGKPVDVLDGPWPNLAPAAAKLSAEPGRLAAAPPTLVTLAPGDPDGP